MIDATPDRRRRRIVLATCSLSLFIVSLDNTIVNVGLPSIERQFGASVSGLQWVVDAYVLVLASLLLFSGATGDRVGRRKVFHLGLVIFGVGSLACSLAPNLGTLVAFRMLQAVGGSMLTPNTLSIISNTFTDTRERAQAIGVWGGVFGVSAAAGPVLGGLLVDTIGWRSIFWVNLPVVAVAFALARRYVPESKAPRPRRPDPPGQLLAVALLASLAYAIIEGPADGWTSPVIVGAFVFAALCLVVFLQVERHRVEPLLELRSFRSPPFSGAASIATLAFMILAGFLFLNTLYLQEARGDSALMAGVSTLPATAIIAISAPLAGRVVGRRGARLPLTASGIALAAGSLVLTRITPHTPFWELGVGYVLLGLGFGMVNPPITNTAVTGMPPAQAGVASAVASTARQVGSVLGVAVLGSVVTDGFHRDLLPRLAPLGLLPAQQAALLHAGIGTGAISRQLTGAEAHQVSAAVSGAFATASHAGWYVAAGCGVATALVALLTTGARAQATARLVAAAP